MPQYQHVYVVVQFYPWFNFDFPLFFIMLICDSEYQTKANESTTYTLPSAFFLCTNNYCENMSKYLDIIFIFCDHFFYSCDTYI